MAVSADSKIKELMKNEAAAELLEKYAPGFKTNPQMKRVQGLTLVCVIAKTLNVVFLKRVVRQCCRWKQNGSGSI